MTAVIREKSQSAELTINETADILNVSRRYVEMLLTEGQIPSRKVGGHFQTAFDDLATFKKRDDEARAKAINELTAEAHKLGID